MGPLRAVISENGDAIAAKISRIPSAEPDQETSMYRMNRAACICVALAFCAINAANAQQNPPRAATTAAGPSSSGFVPCSAKFLSWSPNTVNSSLGAVISNHLSFQFGIASNKWDSSGGASGLDNWAILGLNCRSAGCALTEIMRLSGNRDAGHSTPELPRVCRLTFSAQPKPDPDQVSHSTTDERGRDCTSSRIL
jgi:hypothetical protein